MPSNTQAQVAILMGSTSDWPKIESAAAALEHFEVAHDVHVMSAHRTPARVREYVETAGRRGVKIFIAAAGGAAHLAGAVAAHTSRPVIGIPVATPDLGGLDSLLSTVQMPGDVPVATVGVGSGGARNAGLLAVQILALGDEQLAGRFAKFKDEIAAKVTARDEAFAAERNSARK